MVELLFPRTLSEDMKDVFIHPIGLGLRGVTRIRNVTFLNPLTYLVYQDFSVLSTPSDSQGVFGHSTSFGFEYVDGISLRT